jgi:predicted glycosyltransferase
MSLPKIIIHCQYVYGLGHFVRALHLAQGLSKYFDVYFLNGGEPVKNFDIDTAIQFIQLPAIYKKEGSTELSSVSEHLTLSKCFELRDEIIFETIQKVKPDVVITEHFPFGFLFKKEATKLIDYAKKSNTKTKIVCSVRDVIESSKGGTNDPDTVNILNKLYDLLLIHGDEKLISMSSSFPLFTKIKTPIVYTGYVIDENLSSSAIRSKNILVSVAGGRVGSELLNAVIKAFELIREKCQHNLVVFNGAFNKDFEGLLQDDRIKYSTFNRYEFLKQLAQSDISISLGGYNSMSESLYAGNKVVIYNREFLGSNEEQDIRISTFKNLGLIDIITLKDLDVEKLASVLLTQINKKDQKDKLSKINFDGVKNTVSQIKQLVNGK